MTDAKQIFGRLETQMRLHEERIPAAARRYSLHHIRDAAELDLLFTCYRSTRNKVDCSMKNPFAQPMRIKDVRERLVEFAPGNRYAFWDYVDAFSRDPWAPIQLTLPAYGLSKHGFLLLDGNHRATAASISRRPLEVTLAVLEGPIDRRILVDLKFWDGGLLRFKRQVSRIGSLGVV
jgi:hypothetical protein